MTIAHIFNGELGFDVRTKLNALIDLAGGGVAPFTQGSVLFADGFGNLTQDNANFFWDDTNNALKISGETALFKKAHASTDNWFVAGAGNFTLTGNGNIGVGDGALRDLTTGAFNMALGATALQRLTTGNQNTAIGGSAGQFLVTGSGNVAIGANAMGDNDGSVSSVAIGDNCFAGNRDFGNTGVGFEAGSDLQHFGAFNTMIGFKVGKVLPDNSAENTWIGAFQGTGGFTPISNTIIITDGENADSGNDVVDTGVDFHFTNSNIWSFTKRNTAIGIHLYKTINFARPPTNYERATFDWTTAANVLTIGTQAGGTGTIRPIRWTGLSSKATPISADSLLLLDSASSGDMKTVLISTLPGGGGGGTTILDGSGPPSTGLGAVGDYYVDNDDNAMYGPKAAPGFGPDQSAFPPSLTPNFSSSDSLEIGAQIKAIVAGQITAVRYYRDAAATQIARTVNVWTLAGALLSSASVANDGGGSGWKQITLTTPVSMAVDDIVIASVGNTADYSAHSPTTFPVSDSGDVIALYGAYNPDPGNFPDNATVYNYFVDVVFQATTTTWPMAVDGNAVDVPVGMVIGNTITGATEGSVLFAGPAGVLAQDNAGFFWDNALNDLHIGSTSAYYLGTYRALYRIPSVSGDSWFEGDAGNLSTTGIRNFGTGTGALLEVTTGGNNTAIGYHTLFKLTTGNDNLAFGTDALANCVTGEHNVAIGFGALITSLGSDNLAIGADGLHALSSGVFNSAIGKSGFRFLTTGSYNTGYGAQCGYGLVTGTGNTLVGNDAGYALASGDLNTFIGQTAGSLITSGNSNTLIGRWQGASAAISNVIALSDGGGSLKADYGYSNAGWTFVGTPKAGAPAATDMPSGSFSVIDDTSAGQTWLVFNKAGTIRKVQLT